MIHSGVHIGSVRRESWNERPAALLFNVANSKWVHRFELLSVNADSYALVRNVRGVIWLGAYAGRGAVEFVLHILRRGYSCAFFTNHVKAAQRTFRGLKLFVVPDASLLGTFFLIPAGQL